MQQHRQLEISSAGSRPIYAGNARWTYSHQLTRAGARDGFLPFLLQPKERNYGIYTLSVGLTLPDSASSLFTILFSLPISAPLY